MIGWYSSAGYFPKTIDPLEGLKNLSEITFLDVNKLFIMPEMPELPPEDTDIQATTTAAAYDIIHRYYGSDWYSVSTTCFNGYNRPEYGIENVKTLMPAWDLAYPKTNAFFYNNGNSNDYYGAVYVYKWKRVVLMGTGYMIAYQVRNDGSLSRVNYGDAEFNALRDYGGVLRTAISTPILSLAVPYTGLEVLSKPENIVSLFVDFGYDDNSGEFAIMSTYRYFGNDLFNSVIEEPDYVGGSPPLPPPEDPFGPGGNTEPGGGTGDFDDTSTPIDIPELPESSASDTGFISLFNPSISQLRELSSYMWSDLFDVDGWKKIFANPMDAILGLSIVPVMVPGGTLRPVKVGNISTGVNMPVATTQYVTVDCGAIEVNEYWGAYLDYDPYTKAEIYLPYIGAHALSVDDIMGKTVHVVYHVDILSGACCAYVKCGESVLYSFVGQCSCSIPITGSDWTNVINGALTIAGSIGSMVATGGASAPMAIGTMASAAVNSLKPNVEKSGSMGGMGGMMGIQVPYLILTRPRQALPANQSHYTGYPSFMTVKLGDCQGYTEIESVHLEGIPATQAEISEIETLLKGGVIF